MSLMPTTPRHEQFYQDLVALLKKYDKDMSQREILAIAANMVGKIIALQDQRTMTPDEALKIIMANIEEGNQQVLQMMERPIGRA